MKYPNNIFSSPDSLFKQCKTQDHPCCSSIVAARSHFLEQEAGQCSTAWLLQCLEWSGVSLHFPLQSTPRKVLLHDRISGATVPDAAVRCHKARVLHGWVSSRRDGSTPLYMHEGRRYSLTYTSLLHLFESLHVKHATALSYRQQSTSWTDCWGDRGTDCSNSLPVCRRHCSKQMMNALNVKKNPRGWEKDTNKTLIKSCQKFL